jgi:GxxExxY protein
MTEIVHKELSYKLTGLLFTTHKELGRFRNEKQYADYFETLLKNNEIKYSREYRINEDTIDNKKIRCVIDFLIDDKIILELKVVSFLTKDDYYQVQRYLTSLGLHLGILANFRQYRLAPKRILNSDFLHKDKGS